MNKKYIMLENKLCKELDLLEEKYRTGADMSEGDLRRVDLLVHSLKSLATYVAMTQAENDYENVSNGAPYGSAPYNGAFYNGASYNGNSYTNSYAHNMGRSMDMSHEMSGHFPYYPEERRW